jgi:hypothetical protein
MTEEMVLFYIGGGSPQDELPGFADLLSPLFQDPPGPIISEIHRLRDGGWLPNLFRDLAYKHGLSDLRIALAYAFQAYVKGVTYALSLSELATKPIYRPHWLRDSAIRAYKLLDERAVTQVSGGCFPWGKILSRVFDPEQPHDKIEAGRIRDVFSALRAYSNLESNAWVYKRDWPDDHAGEEAIQKELESFVHDGLEKAEVVPLYKEGAIVIPMAKKYIRKKVGNIAYETFATAIFQPKHARAAELKERRAFRIDTVWKAFVDPGTQDAIAEWKRQRLKSKKK